MARQRLEGESRLMLLGKNSELQLSRMQQELEANGSATVPATVPGNGIQLKVASFDGSGGDDDNTRQSVQIGCGMNMGTGGGPREVFFTKKPKFLARQYIGTVDYQETEVEEPELKEADDIVPVVSFMQVMEATITITWRKECSSWKINVPRPFAHCFSEDDCNNLNLCAEKPFLNE